MDILLKIQQKYNIILNNYKKKYSFDGTITNKFDELHHLFKQILTKEVNGINVTIDKRNEFDLLKGILSQLSGEENKLSGYNLEQKYQYLFHHRDRVVSVLKEVKLPKKEIRDPVIIDKPDYGYHIDDAKFPLLEN